MININETVQYIKRRLGHPNVSIEIPDETIAEIIKNETLWTFQQYIPDYGRYSFSKSSKKYKLKRNLYWVIDPNDREVFWVQEIIPEETEMLANSYPYTMPMVNFESIPEVLMNINKAKVQMQWNRGMTWFQEEGTNRVWIFCEESLSGRYSIGYTRSHAPDLSSISAEYKADFNKLALGETMLAVSAPRSKYSNIGTPLGDIQTNGDNLAQQGQALIDAVVQELDKKKPRYIQLLVR